MPANMRRLDFGDTLAQVETLSDRVNHEHETTNQREDTGDHKALRQEERLHVHTPSAERGRRRGEIDRCSCKVRLDKLDVRRRLDRRVANPAAVRSQRPAREFTWRSQLETELSKIHHARAAEIVKTQRVFLSNGTSGLPSERPIP